MTSLEDKVFQCASGEKRLNPDELRQYFGTYAERVVLAVLLENAEKKTRNRPLSADFKRRYKPFTPTLVSSYRQSLSDQTQFTYIRARSSTRTFQQLSWTRPRPTHRTVLSVHSNQAENLDKDAILRALS